MLLVSGIRESPTHRLIRVHIADCHDVKDFPSRLGSDSAYTEDG